MHIYMYVFKHTHVHMLIEVEGSAENWGGYLNSQDIHVCMEKDDILTE